MGVVMQETCSYSTWFVKGQSIMHIMFQLHDVLRFHSTLVVNVLINIPSSKLKKQFFFNFEV